MVRTFDMWDIEGEIERYIKLHFAGHFYSKVFDGIIATVSPSVSKSVAPLKRPAIYRQLEIQSLETKVFSELWLRKPSPSDFGNPQAIYDVYWAVRNEVFFNDTQ